MPSPFPGMDPYFESDLWASFHGNFASAIAHALVPRVRPNYIVLTEKSYVRVELRRHSKLQKLMFPDLAVVARRGKRSAAASAPSVIAAPVVVRTEAPVAVPFYRVVIRDRMDRTLVTAIEILSPVNKIGMGRRKYLRKRAALLDSDVNLLEIDLLRCGGPLPANEPLPRAWYYVLLHRGNQRPLTGVWPIQLADRLPIVPVPLLEGDADIELDLQEVFNDVYDNYGVGDAVEYAQLPKIPMSPEETTSIRRLLKRSNKR